MHAILLVDSETGVTSAPKQHLATEPAWLLPGVPDDDIHLMVQVMETWIVADPNALQAFYGQGFNLNALPNHADLEQVPKVDVAHALENATKQTRKGRYHKIRHASVLGRIGPEQVRARCKHCDRLFLRIRSLVSNEEK